MKSTLTRTMAVATVAMLAGMTLSTPTILAQQARIEQSTVTLSAGDGNRAELWLTFADGIDHRLSLEKGEVVIDGVVVGGYEVGGKLITGWRTFLGEHAGVDAAAIQKGLDGYARRLTERPPAGKDGRVATSFGDRIIQLLGTAETAAEAIKAPSKVSGPGGSSLAIAPGGVEFDELIGQLNRLHVALRKLGGKAGDETNSLALIVHDDFTIGGGEVVSGNLALLHGTLRMGGEVDGDILILDGSLVLTDDARVEGDILQVGGELEFDGDASLIDGEIVSDFPSAVSVAEMPDEPLVEVAPSVASGSSGEGRSGTHRSHPIRRFARNLGHAGEGLMGALTTFISLGVLGLILVYFAQARVERVADTVRHEFARSFAVGLAGEVLFVPAVVVLCVLVITLPVVPFFVLGTGLAMLAGYVAVAHGAGEMFAQRRYRFEWLERLRRSNSYYYVLSGLVVLLIPFAATAVLWVLGGTAVLVRGMVTFVAAVGTWILVTAGFGSVLLTRAGARSLVIDWADRPADLDLDLHGEHRAEAEPARETEEDEADA